jgi:hypothetical protein
MENSKCILPDHENALGPKTENRQLKIADFWLTIEDGELP